MTKIIKVYFSCTGVGIINRGVESFARDCFDGLHGADGLDLQLFKGAGEEFIDEHCLWNLPRNGRIAPFLGKLIRRNGYVVEQLSSFLPLVAQIKKNKPDLIFYSDSNLGFQLYQWRKLIGVPYRLLFSNGGPCQPPFVRTDFVHQVAPLYYEKAIAAGEPIAKHIMVPYGIKVSENNLITDRERISNLRQKLGLPLARAIVISVGAIDPNSHKRMDYVIEEIAALPSPRPYLVLLGHMPASSKSILEKANQMLGNDGFIARSVTYDQVNQYYQIADIFTLASLTEGFGRVFLEALSYGLPCIVHDYSVMRYVLDTHGIFMDLSKTGNLTKALSLVLKQLETDVNNKQERRNYVRAKFSWKVLSPLYQKMFEQALKEKISW
ncbi:MAG: glycosyltransferase family 4 protein [Microcystaceae cyanobacterium]